MQVAVGGKGGSGKTTISGTLARLFARRGQTVLAIDGDSNPTLPSRSASTGRWPGRWRACCPGCWPR
ncbi:MAG: AAA family ATPase [Actinomycetota bacterium]